MGDRSSRRGRPGRLYAGRAVAAAGVVVAVAVMAAVPAGCGGGSPAVSSSSGAAQGSSQTRQILVKVERGDIVKTIAGQAKLTAGGGKAVAEVTLTGQTGADVAKGQPATVVMGFVRRRDGGMPSPGSGQGSPPAGQVPPSGQAPPPSGYGQDGQGGQGGQTWQGGGGQSQGGDQFGLMGSPLRGGIPGSVTAVSTDADGNVVATVKLDSTPKNASVGDQGVASIEIGVLAQDVLVLPAAAITKNGDTSTVTVIVDGKSERRTVRTGATNGFRTEIVSGLSVGDQVVYEVKLRTMPQGGMPSGVPGGGQGASNQQI